MLEEMLDGIKGAIKWIIIIFIIFVILLLIIKLANGNSSTKKAANNGVKQIKTIKSDTTDDGTTSIIDGSTENSEENEGESTNTNTEQNNNVGTVVEVGNTGTSSTIELVGVIILATGGLVIFKSRKEA